MKALGFWLSLLLPSLILSQGINSFRLPEQLGNYKLISTKSGKKVHTDRADTLYYQKVQAVYINKKDSLWIYLNRFNQAKDARRMIKQMAENIKLGKGGYTNLVQDSVLGVPIYSAASAGKAHFFFRNQKDIFWLAGPPEYCYSFLKTFLKDTGLAENESGKK